MGAVTCGQTAQGRWAVDEQELHINALELLAILFGLQSFFEDDPPAHVRIFSDNSTALAYVNHRGGTHSQECDAIACRIWNFADSHSMMLSAFHIPGSANVLADAASRLFQDTTEWMFHPEVFHTVACCFGAPDIDLFASRLNHQCSRYVSWM